MQIVNTKDMQAIASPTLALNYAGQNLALTGKVLLPQAVLNLGDANNQAESSEDIVYVDEKKPVSSFGITSQLQLQLGEHVQFNYQGLHAKLKGNLALNSAPNRPLTLNGRIVLIDGKYQYRGQTLVIRKGSAFLYANNVVDNPHLALQATKTVTTLPQQSVQQPVMPLDLKTDHPASLNTNALLPDQPVEILIGVNVRGTAQKQQLSLFSEPAGLSQVDIISYLLTGQPSSELNKASAQLLLSAVSNLSPGGGRLQGLMTGIQKSIGLDELAIGSAPMTNSTTQTTQQNTTVTVGKHLSPRLSIKYVAGINQYTNTLQLSYLLSKYWAVQSTASEEGSGVDLLYTIERN